MACGIKGGNARYPCRYCTYNAQNEVEGELGIGNNTVHLSTDFQQDVVAMQQRQNNVEVSNRYQY